MRWHEVLEEMRKILLIVVVSLTAGALPGITSAHGCIKGAAVGGVAGHLAGHHGMAGAAIGCAVGHHRAKMKDKEAVQAQAAAQAKPTDPAIRH
jgi:hypothetical protein